MTLWDSKKDNEKKLIYGFGFSELVAEGRRLDQAQNKNYPDQVIIFLDYRNYVWCLVYEIKRNRFVTFYLSRVANKKIKRRA